MPRVRRLLKELTNGYGPTGFEGPVRSIMQRELSPLSTEIKTDGLGSLIASFVGTAESPRVMLSAHMDELGMLVKYVTPEGFIKFQALGGWLDNGIINHRYIILTRKGPVQGVTGLKTPHVMSAEDRAKALKREDMFIDVGATSSKDAIERLSIRPGDPIAPDSTFVQLNGGALYMAKALDDRVGLAAMVGVMRSLNEDPPPNTTFAVATVQEEVGLRGAQTSSYQVKPDIGINLEAGVAADYPGISSDEAQERLGEGPGIFLHDSSMLPNLKLRDFVEGVSQEKGIPVQFEVLSGYGEDAAEIQRSYQGVPSINIAVPVRYLHNHNGIMNRRDFDGAVALVSEVIRRLNADTVAALRRFD